MIWAAPALAGGPRSRDSGAAPLAAEPLMRLGPAGIGRWRGSDT